MMATHQAAAGVVVMNRSGLVLMVDTVHRGPNRLVLPGGVIEQDESPAAAAEREVLEETGLHVRVSRLLAVAHRERSASRPSGLRFIFDTGTVADDVVLVPQPNEVNELLWLAPDEAVSRHAAPGRPALEQALVVHDSARCSAYLDAERVLEPSSYKPAR